ncbi:MAG: hypothetical protein QNJ00_13055 [Woeseiaceae bacterium]|nr:hypothetical protein [Woeseiaceae bacterium]
MLHDLLEPRLDLADIRGERDWHIFLRRPKLKILFVTDSRFTDTNSVYEYMQGQRIGCTDFQVHRAEYRTGALNIDMTPGPDDPHYENFQFRSEKPGGGKIIDDYHVIYLFAVSSGSGIDDGEFAELHRWMDAGGGIFATGDHSTLGERMASKIPRVGTMRKWTALDGVPPGTGPTRIDTNQPDPDVPGQVNGTDMIPGNVQRDEHPQAIDWIPVRSQYVSAFTRRNFPHEILCHPSLGPIDVMPDHPHEGECVDPATITYTAKVKYGNQATAPVEYPTHAGHQEAPVIVAKGRNAHEYWQAKGELDAKVFDMISVYNGHKSNVGRVVVDSTWHHWYGMNIDGLVSAGGPNWEKIGRYFLNIGKYLAPAGVFRDRCWWDIIDVQFDYPFAEEIIHTRRNADLYELGSVFGEGLRRRWGPCSELEFILLSICDVRPELCELIEREVIPHWDPSQPPGPWCLPCPPFDAIRAAVLGGIVRGTAPIRDRLSKVFFEGEITKGDLSIEEIEKYAKKGVAEALDELDAAVRKDLEQLSNSWFETSREVA